LQLIANFDHSPLALQRDVTGELVYSTSEAHDREWKEMPPLTAAWFLNA
jgi:hypothetical protein